MKCRTESANSGAPARATRGLKDACVSNGLSGTVRWDRTEPLSNSSGSIMHTDTPAVVSPLKSVLAIGDAPLCLGSRDGCILMAPCKHLPNNIFGMKYPKLTTTPRSYGNRAFT